MVRLLQSLYPEVFVFNNGLLDVISSVAFAPWTGGPIWSESGITKWGSVSPVEIGRGHLTMQSDGHVWVSRLLASYLFPLGSHSPRISKVYWIIRPPPFHSNGMCRRKLSDYKSAESIQTKVQWSTPQDLNREADVLTHSIQ